MFKNVNSDFSDVSVEENVIRLKGSSENISIEHNDLSQLMASDIKFQPIRLDD